MKQNMLWTALLVLTVLVTSLPVNDAEITLTLLHTNDFRARYEELNVDGDVCSTEEAMAGQCFGGIARLATVVKEVREESPETTLLLDAGDQFQGSLYFTLFGANVTSYFMNLLEYDALALGNHEFDRGPAGLTLFLENATFDVVSANIDSSNEPLIDGLFAKSVVKNVEGRSVGIVGYTTLDTLIVSSPGSNLQFDDIVSSVQAEVSRLQGQGVDIIIALGHAGFDVDMQIANIPGVDVVIGGQSKTFLYNGDPPSSEVPEGPYPFVVTQPDGRTAVAAQCSELGKYVCRLDVTFNDDGDVMSTAGNPVLLDSSVTPDPNTVFELSAPWKENVDLLDTIVIGTTIVRLEGEEEQCRAKECNLGSAIVEGYVRRTFSTPGENSWNDVSIGLLNGGAVGDSIDRGDFRVSDILKAVPFGDKVIKIDIEGRYLRGALEHSVSQLDPCNTEDLFGGFLQVSGLRVKYDLRSPVGCRVVSVVALCTQCLVPEFEPLEDDVIYRVVLSEFLANGGDGYSVISDNIIATRNIDGVADRIGSEVVDALTGRRVSNPEDGRIQFIDGSDECTPAPSASYRAPYRRNSRTGAIPHRRQRSTGRTSCQRSPRMTYSSRRYH